MGLFHCSTKKVIFLGEVSDYSIVCKPRWIFKTRGYNKNHIFCKMTFFLVNISRYKSNINIILFLKPSTSFTTLFIYRKY